MRIVVLGAAAGGGFPQWNCGCVNCRRARSGDPAAQPRTQCSLAVSADGTSWLLLNAAPDLRQQILVTRALDPIAGGRHSPIIGVVLTSAEIDAVAGLLCLREGQRFTLYATAGTLDALAANPIFAALAPNRVPRRVLRPGEATTIADSGGLTVEPFAVPGKPPLYLEGEDEPPLDAETEDTVGLRVSGNNRSFLFVPGCARLSDAVADRLRGADLLFFDGTLWADDEMILLGLGTKTGRRMGHMSISGPDGSLAALAPLGIARKIYVHLNNTNPVLLDDSSERAMVEAAGWEVAWDGMEITP